MLTGLLCLHGEATRCPSAYLACRSTTILGHKSSMPVYMTATALGKLGHPDGELTLTRAAAKHGIIQMVRLIFHMNASEEILVTAE